MGAPLGLNNCRYTAITTSGTTTVNVGTGIYYGAMCYVLATATGAITILDGTSTISPAGTCTAAGLFSPVSALPIGIRFNTSLVVVTAATNANSWNILWD
jgi:hypothetical protein